MKPFERAKYHNMQSPEQLAQEYGIALSEAQDIYRRLSQDEVYLNDKYQVAVRRSPTQDMGNIVHLSIKRIDREVIHDWRDLQEIKNLLVGPECEGVELYPAESRRVDTANQYHLWVFETPGIKWPIGFTERLIMDKPRGKAKQRPFT